MRRVIVESPFAGRGNDAQEARDAFSNFGYVKDLCRHIALRGDAPYASHIFCTQFLYDSDERERAIGIELGLHWGVCAQLTVVGIDRGISRGMRQGIERARKDGRPIEWISLPEHRDVWLPDGVSRNEFLDLLRAGDLGRGDLFGPVPDDLLDSTVAKLRR